MILYQIFFYNTHVQDYGWLGTVTNGNVSEMSEESKRLEAIQISLSEITMLERLNIVLT